jgi:hypothetical protein
MFSLVSSPRQIWAYSPAGDAMDLRHYTQKDAQLNLSYEDNPDPSVTSTPFGMARSYEVCLLLLLLPLPLVRAV